MLLDTMTLLVFQRMRNQKDGKYIVQRIFTTSGERGRNRIKMKKGDVVKTRNITTVTGNFVMKMKESDGHTVSPLSGRKGTNRLSDIRYTWFTTKEREPVHT